LFDSLLLVPFKLLKILLRVIALLISDFGLRFSDLVRDFRFHFVQISVIIVDFWVKLITVVAKPQLIADSYRIFGYSANSYLCSLICLIL